MLDKLDLDRSFLLKDKMELLWADDNPQTEKSNSPKQDEPTMSLKQKVDQKRLLRKLLNKQ